MKLPLTVLLVGACSSCGSVPMMDTRQMSEPLQMDLTSFSETDSSKPVNLITASSTGTAQGRATGAIRLPSGTQPGVNYTCGATFVSPHYAITAAHCVAAEDTDVAPFFTVEQYDTSQLDVGRIPFQGKVNGSGWPNWSRGMTELLPIDGYHVTSYTQCSVAIRCDPRYGSVSGCPLDRSVDIALFRCADRPASAPWTVAFATDQVSPPINEVEVWWFHELLDLADNSWETTSNQPPDNFEHYGQYLGGADRPNNFHYTIPSAAAPRQLLPLRSTHWGNGPNYHRLPDDPFSPTVIWTDVPACHGMSGSGFFPRGSTAMLGPTINGGSGIASRLCADMKNNALQGTAQSSYARSIYTGALLTSAVMSDRER
ncbi:MAG TPA: trypsin-like serine protease [Polyangiaceae bacterium]|nr:trypsin-like serine protease [Polyangiaceae bacterium]